MGICWKCYDENAFFGLCWYCDGDRIAKVKEEDEQLERVNEIAEKENVTNEDIEELTDWIEDEIKKCEEQNVGMLPFTEAKLLFNVIR